MQQDTCTDLLSDGEIDAQVDRWTAMHRQNDHPSKSHRRLGCVSQPLLSATLPQPPDSRLFSRMSTLTDSCKGARIELIESLKEPFIESFKGALYRLL